MLAGCAPGKLSENNHGSSVGHCPGHCLVRSPIDIRQFAGWLCFTSIADQMTGATDARSPGNACSAESAMAVGDLHVRGHHGDLHISVQSFLVIRFTSYFAISHRQQKGML